jgi:hypothetical protein
MIIIHEIPEPGFGLIHGIFIDSDVPADFVVCHTSDGKNSYYGYEPSKMTIEQALAQLKSEIAKRGLKVVP